MSGRWNEAAAWTETGLDENDIQELKLLIERRRYKHPIIGIWRSGEDELRINVGGIGGPLIGAGTRVLLRHHAEGWKIETEVRWRI